jgi:multidrug efflux system membrane fusion protein
VTLSVRTGALLVPARAVQTGQDGAYVFVVQADQTVASRPVVLSDPVGSEVVVTQGLAAGEQVVTEGQLRLAPGMRVEVRDGG